MIRAICLLFLEIILFAALTIGFIGAVVILAIAAVFSRKARKCWNNI